MDQEAAGLASACKLQSRTVLSGLRVAVGLPLHAELFCLLFSQERASKLITKLGMQGHYSPV